MKDIIRNIFFVLMATLIAGGIFYASVYQLWIEHTVQGTITRVDLLPGHIGSTMDKSVVSFSDGNTMFFNANQFSRLNIFVNKTVLITYYYDGYVIKDIEIINS